MDINQIITGTQQLSKKKFDKILKELTFHNSRNNLFGYPIQHVSSTPNEETLLLVLQCSKDTSSEIIRLFADRRKSSVTFPGEDIEDTAKKSKDDYENKMADQAVESNEMENKIDHDQEDQDRDKSLERKQMNKEEEEETIEEQKNKSSEKLNPTDALVPDSDEIGISPEKCSNDTAFADTTIESDKTSEQEINQPYRKNSNSANNSQENKISNSKSENEQLENEVGDYLTLANSGENENEFSQNEKKGTQLKGKKLMTQLAEEALEVMENKGLTETADSSSAKEELNLGGNEGKSIGSDPDEENLKQNDNSENKEKKKKVSLKQMRERNKKLKQQQKQEEEQQKQHKEKGNEKTLHDNKKFEEEEDDMNHKQEVQSNAEESIKKEKENEINKNTNNSLATQYNSDHLLGNLSKTEREEIASVEKDKSSNQNKTSKEGEEILSNYKPEESRFSSNSLTNEDSTVDEINMYTLEQENKPYDENKSQREKSFEAISSAEEDEKSEEMNLNKNKDARFDKDSPLTDAERRYINESKTFHGRMCRRRRIRRIRSEEGEFLDTSQIISRIRDKTHSLMERQDQVMKRMSLRNQYK